ncbi:DNA polymerase [Pseudoalteromonas sp. MMG024]|uniref:DNA polymerase n=1 Tax=Pseudoalteromonas sp. MMG024 TaxID=2909980 RepID=UPI001F01CF4E|nr:DNA polymerase [Pseudoalteromonas sp. MMG024]MCF6459169.1 DNA polymerase [Pseudoalteromonas sp. MMG024]
MNESQLMSIGFIANTHSSLSVIDALGKEYAIDTISPDSVFLCFNLPKLIPYLYNAGIEVPSRIIDLRVEYCLLKNVISGRCKASTSSVSVFDYELSEIAKLEGITRATLSDELWLHPFMANNSEFIKKEQKKLTIRNANWQIELWKKISNKVSLEHALARSTFSINASKITLRGIKLNSDALDLLKKQDVKTYKDLKSFTNSDYRSNSPIRAFGTSTGRNSKSSASYPLSIKSCYRTVIIPVQGNCLLHLDYHRQEIGIAAALSKDSVLLDLYKNGDPYSWFAQQVTPHISIKSAKRLFISLQYGSGVTEQLLRKTSLSKSIVTELYNIHQDCFSRYWTWTTEVLEEAYCKRRLDIDGSWYALVNSDSPPLSIINWPIQATGALLLRRVVNTSMAIGYVPIGLNHDGFLYESEPKQAFSMAKKLENIMKSESLNLLGIELKVSTDIGSKNQNLLSLLEK